MSIGIEHIGFSGQQNLGLSADAYARLQSVSAALVRSIISRYGIPATRITRDQVLGVQKDPTKLAGLIGHMDIPNPSPGLRCSGQWGGVDCHTDPGVWDWNRYLSLITGPAGDFSFSWSPYVIPLVPQGNSYIYTPISITSLNSFGFPVKLSLTNPPAGVTATFTPATITAPINGSAATVLKVQTISTTPTGYYSLNILGSGGTTNRSTTVPFNVVPGTGTIQINAKLSGNNWTGQITSYTASGSSNLYKGSTIPATMNNVPVGQYTVSVSGGPGLLSSITPSATQAVVAGQTTAYTLNFVPAVPPLSSSCSLQPTMLMLGGTTALKVNINGGRGPYQITAAGQNLGQQTTTTLKPTQTGTFTAQVVVKDSSGLQAATSCAAQVYPPLTASCTAKPNPAKVNQTVTWQATGAGGSGSYSYGWLNGTTTSSYSKSYTSAQTVSNQVTITDRQLNSSKTGYCSLTVQK